MPLASTTETAALIPGARVEVVAEAGHFPWLERRGHFRTIVEAFLAEHPAPVIPDTSPRAEPADPATDGVSRVSLTRRRSRPSRMRSSPNANS